MTILRSRLDAHELSAEQAFEAMLLHSTDEKEEALSFEIMAEAFRNEAVGKMIGLNTMLLMHGKTSPASLEVLMRSPDKDLSEAVNSAVRNDPTFK